MKQTYRMPASPAEGNSSQYDPENLKAVTSELNGKTIAMLGSSITYGFGSEGISFAEMIAAIDQCRVIKQAISGTTLAYVPARPETRPDESYVRQMLDHIDPSESIDAFVIQLSTNDAQKDIPMGEISGSFKADEQDCATITGAMEFLLAYIRDTWHCPVVFYINAYLDRSYLEHFASEHLEFPIAIDEAYEFLVTNYEQMIERLYELQKKWHFGIADLWNCEETRSVTHEEKDLLMNDIIHPKKSGYLFWYVPAIEEALKDVL